jgi:membrane carboxypeptidase/penicillin-binding protein
VAAKSGSTNNLRDAWIMGYTPNLAVGAWVGNNNNEPMGGGLSGLITTPLWRDFMDVALEKLPEETFPQPQIVTEGVKPILRGEYIDTERLLKAMQERQATEITDEDSDEESAVSPTINISSIYQNIHTILHFVDKDNPQGGYPANPRNDPQYENWEYGVRKWTEETFELLLTQSAEEAANDVPESSEE